MAKRSLPRLSEREVEHQIRRAGLPRRDEARLRLALLMRQLRHRRGLTQRALAKRAGTPIQELQLLEGAGLAAAILRPLDLVARELARRPEVLDGWRAR